MKTSSTLLVVLIAVPALAFPAWKMPRPGTQGSKVFVEAKKPKIAMNSNGVAIDGYDPIAYFKQNKPVKGSPANQSVYQGARFYFASAADKQSLTRTLASMCRPTAAIACIA